MSKNQTFKILNGRGNLTVPAGITFLKIFSLQGNHAMSAGNNETLLRKKDGALWAMGSAQNGGRGDGTNSSDRSSPVAVVGGHKFKRFASGSLRGYALKDDGTLWAWGDNSAGNLGDGTASVGNHKSSPVQVVGVAGVNFIDIGANSFALDDTGQAWAWGPNTGGEVGNGTSGNAYSSPIAVIGGHVFVKALRSAAGGLGLKADGTVWCWGGGGNGANGDGTTVGRSSPVIVAGSHEFIDINTGTVHAALKADGSVYTWGFNASGCCGVGDNTNRSSPTLVVGGHAFAKFMGNSTFGNIRMQKSDGSIWTWGANSNNVFGNGTNVPASSPIMVFGPGEFFSVTDGGAHALGQKMDGSIWGWGAAVAGAAGSGPALSSPTMVVGPTDFMPYTGADESFVMRVEPGQVIAYDLLKIYPRFGPYGANAMVKEFLVEYFS